MTVESGHERRGLSPEARRHRGTEALVAEPRAGQSEEEGDAGGFPGRKLGHAGLVLIVTAIDMAPDTATNSSSVAAAASALQALPLAVQCVSHDSVRPPIVHGATIERGASAMKSSRTSHDDVR